MAQGVNITQAELAAAFAGGLQLAGASTPRTSDFTTTANIGSPADITTPDVTFTYNSNGDRPILLVGGGLAMLNGTASEFPTIFIREGSTILGEASCQNPAGETSIWFPCFVIANPFTPTAGAHTYKLSASRFAAGTTTIKGATGSPIYLFGILL